MLAPAHVPDASPTSSRTLGIRAGLSALLALFVVVCIGWNARNHPDARIGNPEVSGAPRPVRPLFGFDHWLAFWEIFAAALVAVLIVLIVGAWRRYGPHPQGFLEENGQKGPYSPGIWSTYMSGQPDGRPTVTLGSKSKRCGENNNA